MLDYPYTTVGKERVGKELIRERKDEKKNDLKQLIREKKDEKKNDLKLSQTVYNTEDRHGRRNARGVYEM